MSDCRLCGVRHDPATHAAVQRVRAWLRRRLELVESPPPVIKPRFAPYRQNMAAIRLLRCPASRAKKAAGE